jgi:hypothetical protein
MVLVRRCNVAEVDLSNNGKQDLLRADMLSNRNENTEGGVSEERFEKWEGLA